MFEREFINTNVYYLSFLQNKQLRKNGNLAVHEPLVRGLLCPPLTSARIDNLIHDMRHPDTK